MNAVENNRLAGEARLQIRALKKISVWRTLAIAISTIGVALLYAGYAGNSVRHFIGIPGILMVLLGTFGAIIFNLGLKNGRRNVEKILNILDKGKKS